MSVILELRRISKHKANGDRPYMFEDASASVTEPSVIFLQGASGQGKTTLLRIVGKLEIPDSGTVLLHGKPSEEWKPSEWRKRAAYVSQQPVMLEGSIEDNLRTVSRLHGTEYDSHTAKRLMDRSGLELLPLSKDAGALSGGEQQRVALIRSMLLYPDVLLLDEVTSALDPASKRAVEELLLDWHRHRGTTLLWISHDPEQAERVGGGRWTLQEGKLLAGLQRDDLSLADTGAIRESADPVEAYIGGEERPG